MGIGGGNMFFFSSRRRHTRLQGDWSSDVCSSDLWARLHSRGWVACSRWMPWPTWWANVSKLWPSVMGTASNRDRKSTRLNSSHLVISYAVFCLKKKKKKKTCELSLERHQDSMHT